jgi:hypothetical protein
MIYQTLKRSAIGHCEASGAVRRSRRCLPCRLLVCRSLAAEGVRLKRQRELRTSPITVQLVSEAHDQMPLWWVVEFAKAAGRGTSTREAPKATQLRSLMSLSPPLADAFVPSPSLPDASQTPTNLNGLSVPLLPRQTRRDVMELSGPTYWVMSVRNGAAASPTIRSRRAENAHVWPAK